MQYVARKLVTDEEMRPVAVQIDYADWLEIEQRLTLPHPLRESTDLARHIGKLDWPVDGLEYQRQMRSEWD